MLKCLITPLNSPQQRAGSRIAPAQHITLQNKTLPHVQQEDSTPGPTCHVAVHYHMEALPEHSEEEVQVAWGIQGAMEQLSLTPGIPANVPHNPLLSFGI